MTQKTLAPEFTAQQLSIIVDALTLEIEMREFEIRTIVTDSEMPGFVDALEARRQIVEHIRAALV